MEPDRDLMTDDQAPGTEHAHPGDLSPDYPPLSLKKLALLYLATGGLYLFPWFVRCLRSIEHEVSGSRTRVLPRTLAVCGLFLAVAEIQAAYHLAIGRHLYVLGQAPLFSRREWLLLSLTVLPLALFSWNELRRLFADDLETMREVAGGVVFLRSPGFSAALVAALWLCWALPNPYRYAALFSFVPVRRAQFAMNQYISTRDVRPPEETRLSAWEMVFVVVGAIALAWVVGGAMLNVIDSLTGDPTPMS